MKKILQIALLTFLFGFCSANAQQASFIFPEKMDGIFARGPFGFSIFGQGTHNGHISVFNLPRKGVESLLPEQLGLAKISEIPNLHPVIIVWGEINDSSASVFGFPLGSKIRYREWQLYIPGVYSKRGYPENLRTYVARIFVDHPIPEVIGRRFFYKKILLDSMKFEVKDGMSLGEWGRMKVEAPAKEKYQWQDYEWNEEWRAVNKYLPKSDIVGEDGLHVPFRCSGFRWLPSFESSIGQSQVSLKLTKPIVEGMDPVLLNREFKSVASFEARDWLFQVDYYYQNCP